MRAILISEFSELEEWEASYSALLDRVGGFESLYYSLDCIRVSLDTFQTLGGSLFFILVIDAGEVVAVLPFQMIKDGVFGIRRTVKFWGDYDIYARNYHQRILVDGNHPGAMATAASLINGELRHLWDVIALHWFVMDDNIKSFASAFREATVKLSGADIYYYDALVPLDSHLGSSRRSSMRRRMRRLEEDHGEVEFGVKEEINASDLDAIRTIHTARQLHKDNDGDFFSDPLQDEYISKMIDLWNRKKCVRYYTLRVAGKLIAFDILCHVDGAADSFAIAFDTAYAKYSPLRYLSYATYQHEIGGCGISRIVTGCDNDPDGLKLDYSTDKTELHDIGIFNSRFRSKGVRVLILGLFLIRKKVGILKGSRG